MSKIINRDIPSYLRPLFWQHGENPQIITDEIEKMYQNGIDGFIVEARPHPDFLSYGWWRDLSLIMNEAKKRGMEVWIFDDSAYPSGFAAGKVKELYPELLKVYMAENHVDAIGPMRNASVNIGFHVNSDEKLLKVVMAKRADGYELLDENEIYDITNLVTDGFLYMDIPEGKWRIYIIKTTRNGGEEATKDYINPISKKAVEKYLEILYDEHYRHFKEYFGNTIKGFFVDEPRFGNAAGYEEPVGKAGNVLPYYDGLFEELTKELGDDFTCYLPFLWNQNNSVCADIHYAYMNVVSRLFGDIFIGQIGNWCREHGVKAIGHVVEDNGAHARLGYGPGHYFRSMKGFDFSGIDIVYQIWPEWMEGRVTTPFGYLYAEFFYWGLCKMASSAAHIDENKDGVSICEIFGAYGWQEGLKLMKWLTDHACVRGINLLIPHAFSPKFPDDDCPPHFYAKGNNPQWRYFNQWADYANRVCHFLSEGNHIASAAVLYHAEAEWGGAYEPFEKAVHALMANQIDCDVISVDYLCDDKITRVEDGKLLVNKEKYQVLIIPYSENISFELAETMLRFSKRNLPIVFMSGEPQHIYYHPNSDLLFQLNNEKGITVTTYEDLPAWIHKQGFHDIIADKPDQYLRCYHYLKDKKNIYFFTNESKYQIIETKIHVKGTNELICYDAMLDKYYSIDSMIVEENSIFDLCLYPYQSLFIMDMNDEIVEKKNRIPCVLKGKEIELSSKWNLHISDNKEMNEKLSSIDALQDIAKPDLLPRFSGSLTYEICFNIDRDLVRETAYLDLGDVFEISEVWINGIHIGSRICPPYTYNISGALKECNSLRIDVTNTYAKEKGNNIFDAAMPQEPSGLIGPVKLVFTSVNS